MTEDAYQARHMNNEKATEAHFTHHHTLTQVWLDTHIDRRCRCPCVFRNELLQVNLQARFALRRDVQLPISDLHLTTKSTEQELYIRPSQSIHLQTRPLEPFAVHISTTKPFLTHPLIPCLSSSCQPHTHRMKAPA